MKGPEKTVSVAISVCLAVPWGFVGCASQQEHAEPARRRFEEGKVFAAGDCFELSVRRFSTEFTISADGTVELPLIAGRVKVAGFSALEVEKLIVQAGWSATIRGDGCALF